MGFTLRRGAACLAVCAVAIGATACGSGGSSSKSGAGSGQGVGAGTGSRAARAEAAGKRAAGAAGKKVRLAPKTVGILNIAGGIEPTTRAQNQLTKAAKVLGWKVVPCDAQGDPTKMVACGNSLLDRNVAAIFSIGIEPSLITAPLKKAKAKGVPVFNFGGGVSDSPLLAGNYIPDESALGKVLADWLLARFKKEGGGPKQVAIEDYPAAWATDRTKQLEASISNNPGVAKEVTKWVTDLSNPIQDTRTRVASTVGRYPKLGAIWLSFDSTGAPAAQVVNQKYPGKKPPDRPLIVTFHADLANQQLLRKGEIDALGDVAYDASAWLAVDQAAEYFARNKTPSRDHQPDYEGLQFMNPSVVTAANLPPGNQYLPPKDDFVTFFTTKWKNEFTNLAP